MKNIRIFLSEKFPFLVVKFSSYMYLNRRVFVTELQQINLLYKRTMHGAIEQDFFTREMMES